MEDGGQAYGPRRVIAYGGEGTKPEPAVPKPAPAAEPTPLPPLPSTPPSRQDGAA